MPPRHKKRRKNPAPAASAAEKRRDWLVGDLVVAKLRGHRPWPAQIQRPEDYGYEARPHKVFVTFFGTEETCFCTYNKITPFTSAMRKSMAEQLQKLNTNPKLENAIREIFAADDELKVSMRSQAHSDDEKSEDEDEQPPEPSSKPPPRKRAKIATQEDAVVHEPLAHSLGKESSRPTRAGAAAAASAAAPRKQEKVTYVESMAAHQVHKLPRKVRIKVSSQSSDSASLPDVDEAPAVATEKESSSPQSFKSEPLSPERKSDAISALSPETAAGGTDASNNEDVHMEEATADAESSHPEAITLDADVAKKSSEHPSTEAAAEASDSSNAVERNSAKTEVHEDVDAAKELIRAAEQLKAEEAKKDSETAFATKDTETEPQPVVAASSGGKRSNFLDYERKRNDQPDKRVEEALDVANESASQEAVKDPETEGDASPKIQTEALIEKVEDTDAQVEVPTPSEDAKIETGAEIEKVGAAEIRDEAPVSSVEAKIETDDVTKIEGIAEDEVEVPASSREEQSKTDDASVRTVEEAVDVAKESAWQDAEKDRETEIDTPSKTETEPVTKKAGDAEANVEVTASSIDEDHAEKPSNAVYEQGTSSTTGETLDNAEEHVVQDAEKESVSTVVRMEVDAPLKIEAEAEAEAEAAKDMDAEARVVVAASSIDVQVEKLRNAVEDEQERLDPVEESAVKEAENNSEKTIAMIEINTPSKTPGNVAIAASSLDGDHVGKLSNATEPEQETGRTSGETLDVPEQHAPQQTEKKDDNTAVAMEVDTPSKIEVEVSSVDTPSKIDVEVSSVDTPSKIEVEVSSGKEVDTEVKVEVEVSSVDEDPVENLSNSIREEQQEHAVQGVEDSDRTVVEMEMDAPSKIEPETILVKQTDAEAKVTLVVSAVEEDHLEKRSNVVDEADRMVTEGQNLEMATLHSAQENLESVGEAEAQGRIADARGEDSKVVTSLQPVDEKSDPRRGAEAEDKHSVDSAQADQIINHDSSTATGIEEKISDDGTNEVQDHARTMEEKTESGDCQPAVDAVEQDAAGVSSCSVEASNEEKAEPLHTDTTSESTVVEEKPQEADEKESLQGDLQVDTRISEGEVRDNEVPAGGEETGNESNSKAAVVDDVKDFSSQENVEKPQDSIPPATIGGTSVHTEQEKMDTPNPDSIVDAVEASSEGNETTVRPPQEGKDDQLPIGGTSVHTDQEKVDTPNTGSIVDADSVEVSSEGNETTVRPPQEGKDDQVTVGPIEKVTGMDSTHQVKDGDEKVEAIPFEKSVETEIDAELMPTSIDQVVEKNVEREGKKDGMTVDVTMEDKSDEVAEDQLEKPTSIDQVVEKDVEKEGKKDGTTVDVTMEENSEYQLEKPSDVKVENVGKDKSVPEVTENNQIPKADPPSAAPAAS